MRHTFLLVCALISALLNAQNQFDLQYYLPQNCSYNAAIPTP